MSKSCAGCKFLYFQDVGYSNYTVLATEVDCLLSKNPNLGADLPYNWNQNPEKDNWGATSASRCEKYQIGDQISLDVDHEDCPEDSTLDEETLCAFKQYMG